MATTYTLAAVTPEAYGYTGSGDASTAINAALTAISGFGEGAMLWLSDAYTISAAPIKVFQDSHIHFADGASIINQNSTGSGSTDAAIQNNSFSTKSSEFTLTGFGTISSFTAQVSNCTVANGSATVTTTGTFQSDFHHMTVTDSLGFISPSTTVSSVNSATNLTLSQNAIGSSVGSDTLTFTQTGPLIAVYGDYITLADFICDGWAGASAITIVGDHNRINSVSTQNPLPQFGVGGIRMAGGSDFVATGCDIISGDDALQFVPIASSGDPSTLQSQSISDSTYIGCTGRSYAAWFLSVALVSPNLPSVIPLTGSITNVAYQDCHGMGGDRGIFVCNESSTGSIDGVLVLGCHVDQSDSSGSYVQDVLIKRGQSEGVAGCSVSSGSASVTTSGSFADVEIGMSVTDTAGYIPLSPVTLVTGWTSTTCITLSANATGTSSVDTLSFTVGPVQNICFSYLTVTNPAGSSYALSTVGPVDNIALDHARLYGLANATAIVDFDSATNVTVTGGDFFCENGLAEGIIVGSGAAANTSSYVRVDGATIHDIPTGKYGVSFNFASSGSVRNTTFLQASGANSYAVKASSNSSGIAVTNNDLSGLTTSSNTIDIVSGATGCVVRGNLNYNPVGPVTVSVPASGSATAVSPYDQTFYITASTSSVSIEVTGVGGSTSLTIPASAVVSVQVPAAATLTPTYTSAPSWVVSAN